jgi:hypothetical protein
VLAPRLDRESVYQALVSRHFYATTGNRCLVEVELIAGKDRQAIIGDIVELDERDTDSLQLHVRVVGTAPIESIEVRNGLQVMDALRPYGPNDLGNRIKIVWSGAEVRGRDRQVTWDGGLRVRDNTILDTTPIHFWSPHRPLKTVSQEQLAWQSITTGGLSGLILTLREPQQGTIEVKTEQRHIECAIGSLGLKPTVWECGGLRKQIEAYRLPDTGRTHAFSVAHPLTGLHPGDNPIYVRVMQEDGHMAWSSPIYVVCGA